MCGKGVAWRRKRRRRKERVEGEMVEENERAVGRVSKWVKRVEGRMDGVKSVGGVQEARRSRGGNCP